MSMLKYGCYCINCEILTEGYCTDKFSSFNACYTKETDGLCPITYCMAFKAKAVLAQQPCSYFAKIEKSGLAMLS
ncbi:MAG TPA: hypothetical protein VFC84_07290 [Desulfosporosinus sp.]|nr:hypothetical protein [Desulfosporosinus sp.]